jgi:hypothetical protein
MLIGEMSEFQVAQNLPENPAGATIDELIRSF